VAHTAWKKRLHEIVETGSASKYPTDLEHCEFNQWLKIHTDELKTYQHYQKVTELHNKAHQQAEDLINLALHGKKNEAKVQMEYGGNFENLSKELVQMLIDWHDVVTGKKS
jgi:exonuclease I